MGLGLVLVRGVKWGGLLQLFITAVKVASLLGIFALPFIIAGLGRSPQPRVPYTYVGTLALAPQGNFPATLPWAALGQLRYVPAVLELGKILTALLGVLWAYHGWMNIPPGAEGVRRPQPNIPLALLTGVGIIMTLYHGANRPYHW